MNKLIATGVVVGALVFGGGAGAMITNTVAEHTKEAEISKIKAENSARAVKDGQMMSSCREAYAKTHSALIEFADYFDTADAYFQAGLDVEMDDAVAIVKQTRNIRENYLETSWADDMKLLTTKCGL